MRRLWSVNASAAHRHTPTMPPSDRQPRSGTTAARHASTNSPCATKRPSTSPHSTSGYAARGRNLGNTAQQGAVAASPPSSRRLPLRPTHVKQCSTAHRHFLPWSCYAVQAPGHGPKARPVPSAPEAEAGRGAKRPTKAGQAPRCAASAARHLRNPLPPTSPPPAATHPGQARTAGARHAAADC